MPEVPIRQRLLTLDQAQHEGKPLSRDDEDFLYVVLQKKGISDDLRIRAATLLTCEEEAVLERLFAAFPTFPAQIQRILIPLLCGLETYPPYKEMLRFLKETLSESMADWTILCLSKSQYPLAIPVIAAVSDPDVLFHRRIKRLLAKLGLAKLGPFLALMPEVPHAHVYEEVFGKDAYRKLRARTS